MRVKRVTIIAIMGRESLTENKGLNLTLSELVSVVEGLEDPLSWRRIKCPITKTVIIIGSRKCKEKKRFRVG
jgi:hypothetical protein